MIPLHDPSHERNGLLVRAVRLSGDSVAATAQDSVRIVSLAYGYPMGRPNPGAFFPPRTFMLPRSGEWLIVATAGRDWGCVILRVT
jgi:hypothetical protein